MATVPITRTSVKINPDASRVLIRPFIPSPERVVKIMARVAAQPDAEVRDHLNKIRADFSSRHIEVEATFLRRYESISHLHFSDLAPSTERKLLIGSYLTSEYSLESAALFNPSIVPHPNQAGLSSPGSTRFVMSLRAVGEGHISSVAFRSGIIDDNNEIFIDTPTRFVEPPSPIMDTGFNKDVLSRKCMHMGFNNAYSDMVFALLPKEFTFGELRQAFSDLDQEDPAASRAHGVTKENLLWIVSANYDIRFEPNIPISGRALFPYSPVEQHGIEDARFVKFVDDDGAQQYFATVTAWDGKTILSQLISTRDFLTFQVRSLNGECVKNKGMALFPRKVHGKYAMISRLDNENIYLMFSRDVQFWREAQQILKPAYPWEYYQIGNCGSPIETDAGWLLITHGVGAMRRYAIGAVLLDRDDPSRVIGRTQEPFLVANENEREGYVPNVVYSCGSMIHNETLVLPYAMADYASRVVLVGVEELLGSLRG